MKTNLKLRTRASVLRLPSSVFRPLTSVLCLLTSALCQPAFAQGTAFTYQGRLNDGAAPASGIYDLRFTIYDSTNLPGTVIAGPLTNAAVGISNGLFAVALDFGTGVFSGADRWLDIAVRTNLGGSGTFVTLNPRQKITATPYAITAGNVISGGLAAGTYPNAITLNNGGNSFTGNGSGLTAVNATQLGGISSSNFWQLNGNTGSNPTNQFIGTTDSRALELRVNSQRALRFEPTSSGANVIGGAGTNSIEAGALSVVIAGGGGPTNPNRASENFSTVSGGGSNIAGNTNGVATDSENATVSGGAFNTASGHSSTVAGGTLNLASGPSATVSGGQANQATSFAATVPGGYQNSANAFYTFAAGHRAKANHTGTFVWADATDVDFASTGSNQFLVRASGGLRLETTGAGATLNGQNILSGQVTSSQLANGAVGSNQLASGAVTTAALADGAVTSVKMATVSNWFALTIVNPTPDISDNFGNSLAALGNDRLLVGAPQDSTFASSGGAVYLFNTNGILLRTFLKPSPAVADNFGCSVAAVGNNRVLVGAFGADTGAGSGGAAYLFDTNGTLFAIFTNPAPELGDNFGNAVAALGNDRVIIGAHYDNTNANLAGAAYLFNTNGTLLTTFTNPAAAVDDEFGWAVAGVGNDRVLIGAYRDNTNAGAAYLYTTNGTLLTTFNSPSGAGTLFGYSLAAVGNSRVLISAFADNTGASVTGAAYLFSTNGTLLTVFTNPTPEVGDFFGASVAAVGNDRVLIGAFQDNTGATAAGAAYLFSTNGTLLATLLNPTPANGDYFGNAVAALGNGQPLVGAPSDDTAGPASGTAYLFSPATFTPGLTAEGVRGRSITAASLEDGAVRTTTLADGAVSLSKMGVNSVNSSTIVNGSVTAVDVNASTFSTTFWKVDGNSGTTAGTHFLGTTDSRPLDFRVSGQRALRLEYNGDSSDPGVTPDGAPNIIGGSPQNFVSAGVVGATIAGGGATNYNTIAYTNSVQSDFGTVGGGSGNNIATGLADTIAGGNLNNIGPSAFYSTIGGGFDNNIFGSTLSTTSGATIAGGQQNNIRTNANHSAIGGGAGNIITGSSYATIAGGQGNDVGTNSSHSAIGGGNNNNIAASIHATIAGGSQNDIGTNSAASAIGGGTNNNIGANSPYATIPGGRLNFATNNGYASGTRAKANHTGAFVWGDSTEADIASTNANSVTMRAGGGYRLYSNTGASAGVFLAAGGTSWAAISDRDAKKDFAPVDSRAILEKLAALPITQWHYRWEEADGVPHIGPMAQDFKPAFYPGRDDKTITTQEIDGVALAAIQGLNEKLEGRSQRSEDRLQSLEAENAELKQRLATLETIILSRKSN